MKPKATTFNKPVPNTKPAAGRKPVLQPAKSMKPTQRPVSHRKQNVNSSVRSAILRTNSTARTKEQRTSGEKATTKKQVTFLESPIKPRFYAHDASIKDSANAVDECESAFEWEPLTRWSHYQTSFAGTGAMKLFEGTSTGYLTLRRRFFNRYASVQSYEERRRKEAVANGKQPDLGQLEYGDTDIKIVF